MVSVCLPSDASRNTYHLTWVSLTLDEGYLLTAAPLDIERGVAPLSWTTDLAVTDSTAEAHGL